MAQQGSDSFISGGVPRGRPSTSELSGYGGFTQPRRAASSSKGGAASGSSSSSSSSTSYGGGGQRAPVPRAPLPSEGLGVVASSGSIAGPVVGTGMGSSTQLATAVPRVALSRLPVKLPSVDPMAVSAVLTKIGLTAKAPRSASAPKGVPETLVRAGGRCGARRGDYALRPLPLLTSNPLPHPHPSTPLRFTRSAPRS